MIKNVREMAKASFILMHCKRYINPPVIRIIILEYPQLKGLYADNNKPHNKLRTNRMAVVISVIFFIMDIKL